jgi:proteasome accessory factor C
MPKSNRISGTDRYNFMLSLTGYLIQNRQQRILDVAKHFQVSEKELHDAVVTISLSGVGMYRPDELFFLDYDLLEEGILDLSFAPTLAKVPRLSARQAAAIASGLSYLESIVTESDRLEIEKLQEILCDGSKVTSNIPFKVQPAKIDRDLSLVRQAIVEGKVLSCSYINSADEVSQRRLEPVSLESNDAVWFLRAYCQTKKQIRVFRIDRMRETFLTQDSCIPESYMISAEDSIYQVSEQDTEVLFEIEPEGFGLLADFKPDYPVAGDKTLRVTIPIGQISNLGKIVAKYSGKVRVLAPAEARLSVANFVNRALGNNPLQSSLE